MFKTVFVTTLVMSSALANDMFAALSEGDVWSK